MAKNKYHLHLKGFVGDDDFNADYVDYILAKYPDEPVNVLIDSLGGYLATALSISAAFARHGNVTVHYVGMNASAATIASLGAVKVTIDTNAMYLVHKASQTFLKWASLNADEMQQLIDNLAKSKEDLDKIDCNIAAMYANRCKRSSKDLLELMARGGWLTAAEAKEWGFVDEITAEKDEKAPSLTEVQASVIAAAGIPVPKVPIAATQEQKEQSFFAQILTQFLSFIKGNTKQVHDMETETNHTPTTDEQPVDVLALQAQIDTLTSERDNLQNQVNDLQNRIEALNHQNGDEPKHIKDDKKGGEKEENALSDFFNSMNEATRLYNLLH